MCVCVWEGVCVCVHVCICGEQPQPAACLLKFECQSAAVELSLTIDSIAGVFKDSPNRLRDFLQ